MERLLLSVIRECLVLARSNSHGMILRSGHGAEVYVPVKRHYRMDRFDLAGMPRLGGPDGPPIKNLETLFDHLHDPVDPEIRQRLLGELENSRANTEDSLRALRRLGSGQPGQGDLADWEGRVWLGHPLHPGSRLRSGVSQIDSERFAPEWQPRLELPLLEIPAEDLIVEGDLWTEMETLYPGQFSAGDTVKVPVHPWAAERDLPQRFAAQLSKDRWRFSADRLPARPSMSFRSVLLDSPHGDAHLKLPVAVQTTGATRTVSVAAAHNGPLMSRFLEALWAQSDHPDLSSLKRLSLMSEPASFRLADDSQGQSRFLAGILRRGPGPAVDGQRWLLPAAALLEPKENPLFPRAARYFGCSNLRLWELYVNALLPPLCLLCGQLGIALEGHPQNMVVEFLGRPGTAPTVRFHYRDLGGIRLHPDLLTQGLSRFQLALEAPRFWPGSATCTQSSRDLASKLIYSVLQNHLGELSRAVVRRTGENESPYWDIVRATLERARPDLGDELANRVFAPHWDLKAMWRMRLQAAITEYTYAPVDSPLAAGDRP
jgi:siderophore synthetase component